MLEEICMTPQRLETILNSIELPSDRYRTVLKFQDCMTYKMWMTEMKNSPFSCAFYDIMPGIFKTPELHDEMMENSPKIYEKIPDDLKTERHTHLYLDSRGENSETDCIPCRLLSDSVLKKCLDNDLRFYKFSQLQIIPVEFQLELASRNPNYYKFINPAYVSYENWMEYAKAGNWSAIPQEYKTEEMLFICISDKMVLTHGIVDPKLITLEMAFKLVRKRSSIYEGLSEKLKESSYELALLYSESKNAQLYYIPQIHHTHEIIGKCKK